MREDRATDRDWVIPMIYGEVTTNRFTQDTPVLPDVWVQYVLNRGGPVDLILTPCQDATTGFTSAGQLCRAIVERAKVIDPDRKSADFVKETKLAYNQSTVVASLKFLDLVRIVLPMSIWWFRRLRVYRRDEASIWHPPLEERIERTTRLLCDPRSLAKSDWTFDGKPVRVHPDILWMARIVGTIYLACESKKEEKSSVTDPSIYSIPADEAKRLAYFEKIVRTVTWILKPVDDPIFEVEFGAEEVLDFETPRVFMVSQNRKASSSIYQSRDAVKADAVARVFDINCSRLTWAVVDSGIDAEHPAFRLRHVPKPPAGPEEETKPPVAKAPKKGSRASDGSEGGPRPPASVESYYKSAWEVDENGVTRNRTRVLKTYDFTLMRDLLRPIPIPEQPSIAGGMDAGVPERLLARIFPEVPKGPKSRRKKSGASAVFKSPEAEALWSQLTALRRNAVDGRELDWSLTAPLIEVPHRDGEYIKPTPQLAHGTHVAGIIGADWRVDGGAPRKGGIRGICPDIRLYDLRVFDPNEIDADAAEFTIMAALQYVRYLNANINSMVVHGVNLSLSIRHVVESYACGRTPVCVECERLVGNGIVVVAAAGNNGHLKKGQENSLDDRYESMTITDPGNAEAVITVGSTHRTSPHDYGVSYFSSRGPTGDGRSKPDLVAPGEKIESTIPDGGIIALDGTSMAAPHVSGAAALLMARNGELVGRPARIKQVLCDSATDLGRYRYFQGSGMLDVLRALQSV